MPEYDPVEVDVLTSTKSVSVPFYFLSLPSEESITATFVYNYYTRDEGISETVTLDAVDAESDQYDFIAENWENGAYPRQINLEFTSDSGFNTITLTDGLVTNAVNGGKVIYEDSPFSTKFTGISVHDTSIDEKIYNRGGADIEDEDIADSRTRNFLEVSRLQASGYGYSDARTRQSVVASYEADVKSINLDITLNDIIAADVLNTVYRWQSSAFADEFAYAAAQVQSVQDTARTEVLSDPFVISQNELDVTLSTVDSTTVDSADPGSQPAYKCGYIIEKYGEQLDGTTLRYPDIIIEDPDLSTYQDTEVRYGSIYKYRLRTIYLKYLFTETASSPPSYVQSTVLFASTGKLATVSCIETNPPPPPVNISFQQTLKGLYIRWNFPLNKQKDIKRFQVFRRPSIELPFEIISEIDFDLTIRPYTTGERIPDALVTRSKSPIKNYLDSDFNDLDSDYIYAICAVDAHGYSSGYSEQFRVRFDQITGKLLVSRISTEGAPKPFPNVNIVEDFFSDIIKDSGHTRMRVFFDPEYADVTKDGNSLSLISTSTTGDTTYRIALTELNLGKSQTVDISIGTPTVSTDGIPVSIARYYTAS